MSELENDLLNNTDDSGSDIQQDTPETENKTDLHGELNKINNPSPIAPLPQVAC